MFKTNEYFEGKVKSIAFENESGKYTIGVMDNGEYEFGTSSNEEMTVISGKLKLMMPGQESWTSYESGSSFIVNSGIKFKVKSIGVSSYLCKYF